MALGRRAELEVAVAEHYRPGEPDAARRAIERAGDAPMWAYAMAGVWAAGVAERYDDALVLIREAQRPREVTLAGSWAPAMIGLLEAASGRWADAASTVRGVPGADVNVHLVCALAPFVAMDREALEWTRRRIEESGAGRSVALPPVAQARDRYSLALVDLRLGREAEALEGAAVIDSLAGLVDARDTATIGLLARSIRATAAAQRGETAAALEALGPVDGPIRIEHVNNAVLGRMRERYLLATLLLDAGRPAEAVRWLEHGFWGSDLALLYRPIVHLHLGEAHEELGNAERARHHYAEFLRIWERADPDQPLIERARMALARLSTEPAT